MCDDHIEHRGVGVQPGTTSPWQSSADDCRVPESWLTSARLRARRYPSSVRPQIPCARWSLLVADGCVAKLQRCNSWTDERLRRPSKTRKRLRLGQRTAQRRMAAGPFATARAAYGRLRRDDIAVALGGRGGRRQPTIASYDEDTTAMGELIVNSLSPQPSGPDC